jgi:hypothetical protein
MADKLKGKTKPVRAYPHPSDSRPNIPTAALDFGPYTPGAPWLLPAAIDMRPAASEAIEHLVCR